MANGIESLTCIDIDWHSWHSCFTGGQGYMPKGRNLAPHLLSCVMGFLPLSVSNPVVYWLVACNWVIKWGQGCSTKLISNSVGRKQEVPHKLPDRSGMIIWKCQTLVSLPSSPVCSSLSLSLSLYHTRTHTQWMAPDHLGWNPKLYWENHALGILGRDAHQQDTRLGLCFLLEKKTSFHCW